MIKKIFCLYLFLFSILCTSQNIVVDGLVKDLSNNPIPFANITLFSENESTFIAGATTNEEGYFVFDNLKTGTVNLKISFLGFNEFEKTYSIEENINIGTIILEEKTEELDGVVVVAKRPTVKRMVDRLVFNVENSTLSNNNVLDVLKHTPGVLVNNGTISVKNSTPMVYINDRKVHLSIEEVQQLLEGTPANNIKSIEVITNPPAKYEAEGGAVLNIVTSKNIIAGYNGSIFGNYKQGSEYPKYALGTSHFFKTKKLSTYLNYNISPKREFRHNDEFINFIDDDNAVFSSWETDFKRTQKSANQNINANFDYTINDKNSLGFSTNILIAPREPSKTRTNSETLVFGKDMVLDSIFNTSNRLVEEKFNLAFTLDYLHQFDREGEKISASLHHTNYDFSNFQNVNTGYFLPNEDIAFRDNQFQTFSSQKIKLYTSQIDYELPTGDSGQFEAGGKVSNINSESILNQFVFVNGNREEDLQNSDTFLYDETNYAGYLSFAKDWEDWSLKSGLRAEYTEIDGNSLSTSQMGNNSYFKLFPSLHLSNKINDNNELYLNYNRRIYRPRYSQLNPFKYFINDNTFISGDPNLRPQIDDEIILGYTFMQNHSFEVYYRNEANPIILALFQDNDNNLIKYVNTNIERSVSYGVYYGSYLTLSNYWNVSLTASVFYYGNEFNSIAGNGVVFTSNKWTTYVEILNSITLLEDNSLNIDMSFVYISPYAEGPSILGARSSLDISLRKSFWNNKASLSIGVVDVFNNYNFTETSRFLNQDVFIDSRKESRLITFGFNYKFGNYRLSNSKKDDDLSERNRINNKD